MAQSHQEILIREWLESLDEVADRDGPEFAAVILR